MVKLHFCILWAHQSFSKPSALSFPQLDSNYSNKTLAATKCAPHLMIFVINFEIKVSLNFLQRGQVWIVSQCFLTPRLGKKYTGIHYSCLKHIFSCQSCLMEMQLDPFPVQPSWCNLCIQPRFAQSCLFPLILWHPVT